MWVFSRKTLEIKAVNEAAMALYGYTEKEMLTLTIKNLRQKSELPKLMKELDRSYNESNNSGIWAHQTKNNETIYVNITSNPVEWGGEACKLVVAQNVTNQRYIENILADEESLLGTLIHNFPGLFFLINKENQLVRWNNNAVKISGYTQEELANLSIFDAVPETEYQKLEDHLKTAFDVGWVESDMHLLTKNNAQIPFLFKANRVFLWGEEHLLNIGVNIKILKDTETELNQLYQTEKDERAQIEIINNRLNLIDRVSQIFVSEEELPDALEKVASLLVKEVSDTCSINLLKNGEPYRAAYKIVNKEVEEKVERINEHYPDALFSINRFQQALGEGNLVFKTSVNDDDLKKVVTEDALFDLLKNLNLKSYFLIPLKVGRKNLGVLSLIILKGDRNFYAEDENFLVELADKMALHIDSFLYENDLMLLNQTLEEKVQERTKELERANKELESFSYSVSHDLRAPLRAITGYSNFLIEDHLKNLNEEGQEFLKIVYDETRRMGELIDDLLAFSRMSRTEKQEQLFSMNNLVQETITTFQMSKSDNNVEFIMDDLPDVIADPKLMRQVWLNLLSNAVKYRVENRPSIIKIKGSMEDENDFFTFSVQDNGVGFNTKYTDKLFEVFQRLHSDSEYEGTGIGLALVQRIIHRHGGEVWAESEINKGSTFHFSLPNKTRNE